MNKIYNKILDNAFYYFRKYVRKPKNDGYVQDIIEPENYLYEELGGKVDKEILFKDGNSKAYRSKGEKQKRNGYETMSCTNQATGHTLAPTINYFIHLIEEGEATEEQKEIVKIFRHFELIDENNQFNCSERCLANVSGTGRNGNTLHKSAEAPRLFGLVPEKDCPWVDGWNNYYNLGYKTKGKKELIEQGKKLLEYIEIKNEWVPPHKFKTARQYGALMTSIYAFDLKIGDVYQRTDKKRNHATGLDSLYKFNEGQDSYIPFDKKYSDDFNFGWAKLFTISLRRPIKKESNFDKVFFLSLKNKGFKYIQRTDKMNGGGGQVYELLKNGIKELSEQEKKEKGIQALAQLKTMQGVYERDFKKLI